ncbi:Alpha-(1 4)-fucosyltransferase [Bienertia sinuspersici]
MRSKPITNPITLTIMLSISIFFFIFFSGFFQNPSSASSSFKDPLIKPIKPDPFTNLVGAFRKWDSQIGCPKFRENFQNWGSSNGSKSNSLQVSGVNEKGGIGCDKDLKLKHVNVLVKGWTWIPDNLENLYECKCGLSCFWTKSDVLADPPDALLFETTTPPLQDVI